MSPARARSLGEAGFHTVRDLLFHIPSRYEDRRQAWPVVDAADTAGNRSPPAVIEVVLPRYRPEQDPTLVGFSLLGLAEPDR